VSIDVVSRFLSARESRDLDECVAVVAEDAVWHSPVGPAKHGRAGFREAIEEAYANTSWFATETLEVRTVGERVAARVRNRGERRGEELDSEQLLVFRVQGGQIVDVEIDVDDHSEVAEFWSG